MTLFYNEVDILLRLEDTWEICWHESYVCVVTFLLSWVRAHVCRENHKLSTGPSKVQYIGLTCINSPLRRPVGSLCSLSVFLCSLTFLSLVGRCRDVLSNRVPESLPELDLQAVPRPWKDKLGLVWLQLLKNETPLPSNIWSLSLQDESARLLPLPVLSLANVF